MPQINFKKMIGENEKMKNKQWILSSFPKGDIQDGDLVFQENELAELKG